jgi:hypothetical protein
MAENSETPTFVPAYIAFKTVQTIDQRMAEEGVPARVDKSYLDNFSGGYQSQVLAALSSLGLVNEDQSPSDDLKELVSASGDAKKKVIERIIRAKYARILSEPKNATNQQLIDAFTEVAPQLKGDTRRKAIAFFLAACRYAEIEVSRNWKTPPVARSSSATRKKPSPGEGEVDDEHEDERREEFDGRPLGEEIVIDMGDVGQITVYIHIAKHSEFGIEKSKLLHEGLAKFKELAPKELPAGSDEPDEDDEDEPVTQTGQDLI